MKDLNEFFFNRKTLCAAMVTNCTFHYNISTQERFRIETPIIIGALKNYLEVSRTVVDFGIGVGRIAKAILEHFPNIRLIGIDNSVNMLIHAKRNIPEKYFLNERIKLYTLEGLTQIESNSIDLILAIFVFQHVNKKLLRFLMNELSRVLKSHGRLYVLNCNQRIVPQMTRLKTYKKIRRILKYLDYFYNYKQIQKVNETIDRYFVFDDKVNVQEILTSRFIKVREIPLNGHPYIKKLLKTHFSTVYRKK